MNELKKDILRFSKNWESYLEKCFQSNGGNQTKDENVYKNFEVNIQEKITEIVNSDKYIIKTSLGSGRVAATPYIGIINRSISDSVKEGIFHHIYLKIHYIYPPHFDGSYNVNFKMTISTFKSIFNQLSCICKHFGGLITTQKGIRI